MDLFSLKQYNHRIDKIIITNNNMYSLYSEIMFKVSFDDKYVSDNEVIRFSLEPNDEFIGHQRFDNDYYFMIPNNLKKTYTVNDDNIMYVYAHHFPRDLYEYEEDEQIFSVYDFRELLEEHPKDHYFDEEYETRVNGYDYKWHVDNEGRLIVQSLLKDSVNRFNDPNYKNYVESDKAQDNMTEQGMFPLSSRYRSKQNWTAPNLKDAYPLWKEEEKTRSRNMSPYWEAKINRKGLSPLITNGVENVDWDALPFNVYLNYEYLPTSREYHQHYFGFEPDINATDCKTINVLEGTNINSLDNKFGSNNNYRLINYGNPYDDSHSMYVEHGYEIPFSFNNFQFDKNNCIWDKNICYDFWTYNPENNNGQCDGYCQQAISLSEGDYYSLRFYMYIPSYTRLDENCDTCYVTVTANVDNDLYWEEDDMIQYDHTVMVRDGDNAIYKINDEFLEKDKTITDEWIYHEIPFKAGATNYITIVGPQNTYNLDENPIFFANMSILKMEQYAPTLKYSNTGLYVIEKDQYAYKPSSEEICTQGDFSHPDNKKWESGSNELPRPYSQVHMILDYNTYIEYDEKTSNLYFTHDKNEPLEIEHYIDEDEDKIIIRCDDNYDTKCWYYEHIKDGNIVYGDFDDEFSIDPNHNDNYIHTPTQTNGDLNIYATYKDYLVLVRGSNNKIKIKVQDIAGNPIDTGSITASIITVVNKETQNNAVSKQIGTKDVTNGLITWYNIDLTDLEHNDVDNSDLNETDKARLINEIYGEEGEKYYLRLEYNNPCHNKPYIEFKPFYVVGEQIDMSISINDNFYLDNENVLTPNETNKTIPGQECWIRDAMDEEGNIINFPIKISAFITDQHYNLKTDGYCELSIDDTVVQTTMMDLDGKADFYLDLEDVHTNCQTIKIEYYREYYNSIVFKYFKLCIDPNIDLRPAIPIDIKVLKDGRTVSLMHNCTIDCDDVLLCSISNNYHTEFNIKVEQKIEEYDNDFHTIIQKNILNANQSIDFFDMEFEPNNTKTIVYRITTGNRVGSNGEEIENRYRKYSRTFKVFRKDNENNAQVDTNEFSDF